MMVLARALGSNDNVMTNFFQSLQKADPSQAEEANNSRKANVRANIISQEVSSISEGASTSCDKENLRNFPRTEKSNLKNSDAVTKSMGR